MCLSFWVIPNQRIETIWVGLGTFHSAFIHRWSNKGTFCVAIFKSSKSLLPGSFSSKFRQWNSSDGSITDPDVGLWGYRIAANWIFSWCVHMHIFAYQNITLGWMYVYPYKVFRWDAMHCFGGRAGQGLTRSMLPRMAFRKCFVVTNTYAYDAIQSVSVAKKNRTLIP